MRFDRTLMLLALFVFCAAATNAQWDPNLEQGIKPFGAYSSDFESISMVNGGVTLQIPLLSYSQRGGKLTMNFKLFYTTPGWTFSVVGQGQHQTFTVAEGPFGQYGGVNLPLVTTHIGLDQGYLNSSQLQASDCVGDKFYPRLVFWPSLMAPDGAIHPMGMTSSNLSTGIFNFESVDGTGLQLSNLAVNSSNQLVNAGVIADGDGIQYFQPLNGVSPPYLKEDPNGNVIANTSTGWTDTVGRTIPAPPGGPGSTKPGISTDTTGCQGSLPIVNAYLWSPPGPNGTSTQLKVCFVNVPIQTAFHSPTEQDTAERYTIQSVVTYNGVSWVTSPAWIFEYNDRNATDPPSINYGTLTKITFPTGGTISYTYTNRTNVFRRYIASKTVNANDGSASHVWTYTFTFSGSTGINTVTDPLGNDTVYTNSPLEGTPSYYPIEVDYYQGSQSGGAILRSVKTDYSFVDKAVLSCDGIPQVINVLPIRVTTVWPNGQQSKVETDFDPGFTFNDNTQAQYTANYGEPIHQREFDYGTGTPGSLVRTTNTNYIAFGNSTYLSSNLLALASSVQITDGGGNSVSNTTYSYDESGGTVASGITTQHLASPYGTARGNQTSVHRQLLNGTAVSTPTCPVSVSGGGYLVSTVIFFDTGTLDLSKDPCLHLTAYLYASTFAGAYPTQVTDPLGHSTIFNYDFNTGKIVSRKDSNNNTTTFSYDNLWRPYQITYPDTGQITITRQESSFPFSATFTQKMSASQSFAETTYFDGLGRDSEKLVTSDPDCASGDRTDTSYDGVGQVVSVSNPYCTTGDQTYGVTQYGHDSLGRVTSVIQPDGTSATTQYTGAARLISDEGNGTRSVQTIVQSDGLNRNTSVCQLSNVTQLGTNGVPSACGQAISGTGFLTSYQYDALGRLTNVAQTGLNPRTFAYDSMSRLTSTLTPESNLTSYTYDADGNIITRTRPAPNQTNTGVTVTTTSSYDVGNRLLSQTYSDGVTPAKNFQYDVNSEWGIALSNTVGRLVFATSGSTNSGSVSSYDTMGRTTASYQCTSHNCGTGNYPVLSAYDLMGHLTSSTNGFGTQISYQYNGASRLKQVTSSLNDSFHPGTLFSQAVYNAPGELASYSLGNGLAETRSYDNRLRLAGLHAGTIYNLSVTYNPNSDILSANDSVNGNWIYGYDDFDRLKSSTKTGQAYTYDYDRYGNRWHQYLNGACTAGSSFCITFGANNRISSGAQTYDAAGNVLSDSAHTYVYDAENRLIKVDGGAAAIYGYDAFNRRVRKTAPANSFDYIYDIVDRQVSQADPTTGAWDRSEIYGVDTHLATYVGGTTYFSHADWLGTERARSSVSGTSAETCTSLPFGDNLSCTNTDVSPLHFTHKERDSESGLDNFGARYNASAVGRWMSPDAVNLTDARILNPAGTINKYVYGGNNPLKYLDPDGRDITLFYDAGGVAGHLVLLAYNQETGDSAVQSFGPANHDIGTRMKELLEIPVPGKDNYNLDNIGSADELRRTYASLTIQTTPEEAQQAIDYIRTHPGGQWSAKGDNCATTCAAILRKVKMYNGTDKTPFALFVDMYSQYTHGLYFMLPWHDARNGVEYGRPRSGYNAFDVLFRTVQVQPLHQQVTHKICQVKNGQLVCP